MFGVALPDLLELIIAIKVAFSNEFDVVADVGGRAAFLLLFGLPDALFFAVVFGLASLLL